MRIPIPASLRADKCTHSHALDAMHSCPDQATSPAIIYTGTALSQHESREDLQHNRMIHFQILQDDGRESFLLGWTGMRNISMILCSFAMAYFSS